MAEHSLGIVTNVSIVNGVRATNNQSDPTARVGAQGYSFQALAANTGVVYICDTQTPNLVTGVGVLWVIPKPSASDGSSVPLLGVDNPTAPVGFNMAELWVLPAVSNEGVRVSYIN